MAENCRNDEWMLVEIGEHGPIAVGESEMKQVMEKRENIMKAYYIFNSKTKDLFEDLIKMMPRRPKGILFIQSKCPTQANTGDERRSTSHSNYQVKTAAAKEGPDLTGRAKELLFKAGIKTVRQETSLLKGSENSTSSTDGTSPYICDIPLCQLLLQSNRDAAFHYNLGQALAPLMHEDVVIVGLSNIIGATDSKPCRSSYDLLTKEFDKWLNDTLLNKRFEEIIHFEAKIPQEGNVISLADWLYPLLVVMGAAGKAAIPHKISYGWSFSSNF